MKNWIPNAVIYQINFRSLALREPRNAFEAMREKPLAESPIAYVTRNLPQLRKFGVNVLYIMPPYTMGKAQRKGIGSPYAASNFLAIEEEHGTLEEMKQLVRRAHKLSLKVIFDITPNHTSPDHVWISEHPEYYVKRDNGDIFYDLDWSDTAKLDYTAPGLRKAMMEVYDHWLSFLGPDANGNPDGVDGFRLDMAHFINDKSFWNEAMPLLKERHASRQLLFMAECYALVNNLDLFERGINGAYDDDFYKCCQFLYGMTENTFKSRIIPDPSMEENYDFRDRCAAFKENGIAGAFETALTNYESRLKGVDVPHVSRYTGNHDEGRGMYLFGEDAVRAVNTLIFLSPHTMPFIYTGEEFGAMNRPPIHDRINPIGKCRRLINPDGHVRYEQSVECEGNIWLRGQAERRSMYEHFQALIKLRQKNPALTRGSFKLLATGEDCASTERSVVAFKRTYRGKTLHCAVNVGPEDRALNHAAELFSGKVIFGGMKGNVLPAFSAIVTEG